ncbi:MAG: WhiB family transcriptional regulator [Acidimicrobiales bacterium]
MTLVATEVRVSTNWQDHAACKGVNVALFFPVGDDVRLVTAARAVCGACPVAGQCLEAGLNEPEGIWGGRTADERRALRNRRATWATRV